MQSLLRMTHYNIVKSTKERAFKMVKHHSSQDFDKHIIPSINHRKDNQIIDNDDPAIQLTILGALVNQIHFFGEKIELNHLLNKSMSPPKPVASRHSPNWCIHLTCKSSKRYDNHQIVHYVAKCPRKITDWSASSKPSWMESGYTKLAGDRVVSWKDALLTEVLRLWQGRRLSG